MHTWSSSPNKLPFLACKNCHKIQYNLQLPKDIFEGTFVLYLYSIASKSKTQMPIHSKREKKPTLKKKQQ
jgi:hypothetical protein